MIRRDDKIIFQNKVHWFWNFETLKTFELIFLKTKFIVIVWVHEKSLVSSDKLVSFAIGIYLHKRAEYSSQLMTGNKNDKLQRKSQCSSRVEIMAEIFPV